MPATPPKSQDPTTSPLIEKSLFTETKAVIIHTQPASEPSADPHYEYTDSQLSIIIQTLIDKYNYNLGEYNSKLLPITISDFLNNFKTTLKVGEPDSLSGDPKMKIPTTANASIYIYMDLLLDFYLFKKNAKLDPTNCYKLIAASLLLSYKFINETDMHYDNATFARKIKTVEGNKIPTAELNQWEREMYQAVCDRMLPIMESEYQSHHQRLLAGFKPPKLNQDDNPDPSKKSGPNCICS